MTVEPGVLPNAEAERAVLGAMLLSTGAVAEVVEAVDCDGFTRPENRIIFDALIALYAHGEPTDVIAVGDFLLRRGALGAAGGVAFLHALTAEVTTPESAGYWATIVADTAALRTAADTGQRIHDIATSGRADAADVLHWAAKQIHDAAERLTRDRGVHIRVAVDGAIEYIEMTCAQGDGPGEVPTGIAELDELTGGLRPGELVVIAGETGAGKSRLVADIAREVCVNHGLPTFLFTMEMTASEVAMRMLSAQASVPLADLRNGTLAPASWSALAAARAQFADAPLHIDDTMTQTIDNIRLAARQRMNTGGLRLLIVDHLQLLPPGAARELKMLARDLRVPVIAVSQLEHHGQPPTLANVPADAAQNADAVLLIAGSGLVLAKHRHGPVGTITGTAHVMDDPVGAR